MRDNPAAIKNAFEQNMQTDLQNAMQDMANTMQGGQQTLDDVFNAFQPNVALLEDGSKSLAEALQIFNQIPKPSMNPLQALTTPGATSTRAPSIWDGIGKGESGGLKVSLDGNKIEMSGPVAEKMVHHLSRIEENLEIE
jgi:exonuclease VII small subunit